MSAANETIEVTMMKRSDRSKRPVKRYYIAGGIALVIAILLAGLSYYQATRFNSQIAINETKVGGLTAEEAIEKLKSTVLTNKVYVGDELILDEEDTRMAFSEQDLPEVKKLLKSQWTFFPSFKAKNYPLLPQKADQFRSESMKSKVEEKLQAMNKNLKAPQDAEVKLEDGKIVVTDGIEGEQFDTAALLKDYQKQKYTSEIHLKPVFLQPIKADSPTVKKEEEVLQAFLQRTVDYKVQETVHTLKAGEVIKGALVGKDMKVVITANDIKSKIDEINNTQATLNKTYNFKTHSGEVVQVKGQGYGWALDVEKEAELVLNAFENGETSVSAANISGKGWSNEGIGYGNITNDGIGDTYAEVSIKEQRIWIYKNGQLALTTNVVTGKHITGEDTSPGVWYILYKRQNYTLRGTAVGKGEYAVEVKYWAPFTNSGQGFHDASWRTNWSNTAYINAGSGGCVNTPPNIMKMVYDNLSTYDPVVIY